MSGFPIKKFINILYDAAIFEPGEGILMAGIKGTDDLTYLGKGMWRHTFTPHKLEGKKLDGVYIIDDRIGDD